tara:strand:+ start:527 stop:937 length:411 start_codon:yes stop_codon:yes gene_type:complete
MTSQRSRNRRHSELAALAVLESHRGEWLGATDVAKQVGERWRPLAFALRRLSNRGIVSEKVIEIRGTARSKENRRLYCIVEVSAAMPLPFMRVHRVPPGVARRVVGRCSLEPRNDGRDDLDDPHHTTDSQQTGEHP